MPHGRGCEWGDDNLPPPPPPHGPEEFIAQFLGAC
jgi:hypothetical protein